MQESTSQIEPLIKNHQALCHPQSTVPTNTSKDFKKFKKMELSSIAEKQQTIRPSIMEGYITIFKKDKILLNNKNHNMLIKIIIIMAHQLNVSIQIIIQKYHKFRITKKLSPKIKVTTNNYIPQLIITRMVKRILAILLCIKLESIK